MAKAAREPAPLTVVPPAPLAVVSHALTGTLDERIRAFDQIAANLATLQLNGWDTVQKIRAACWLADAKGEHPAVFVESHYVMLIQNRLTVEPKWEYMVRKMKETVPGFRYKVEVEEDDRAVVWVTDGVDEHRVEYTTEDARRQGLLGRGGNAWGSNKREMNLKQATKRAIRRLGIGRATPWVEVELPYQPETDSVATVVEAGGGPAPDVAASGKAAANADRDPQPKPDPVVELSKILRGMYGKQSKEVLLDKASLIYNEMLKAQTGAAPNPPVKFKRADNIGPVEAQQMIDYLAKRGQAPESVQSGGMDPQPAPEPEEAPPAAEIETGGNRDITDDYAEFATTVQRARKLFAPRKFIVEAPAGSDKFWFVDQATFSQAGHEASIKLMSDGEIMVDRQLLLQLNRILAADCDAAERGRP